MTLLAEMLRALSSEAGIRIQYTVVEGQGGYFQNVKKISEFSETKIVLLGKRSGICVEGAELSIEKYCGGDAVINGIIRKVEHLE